MASKGSGTGGRAAKGVEGSAQPDDKKDKVGSLNTEGLEAIADRYSIESLQNDAAAYNARVFEEEAKSLKGIDLIQLDEDTRNILADYDCDMTKARIKLLGDEYSTAVISWSISVPGTKEKIEMVRSFETIRGERIMTNVLLDIPENMRGKGLAKNILYAQLQQAKAAGISTIAVHANLDVGGYTWARMGFQPDDDGMSELCGNLGSLIVGERKGRWTDKKTGKTIRRYYTDSELKRAKEANRELGKIWDENESKGVYRIQGVVEKYSDVLKPAWLGASWTGTIDLRDKQNLKDYESYLESGKQAQIEEGKKTAKKYGR